MDQGTKIVSLSWKTGHFPGVVLLGIGKHWTKEASFSFLGATVDQVVGTVINFHNSTREMILQSMFYSWGN